MGSKWIFLTLIGILGFSANAKTVTCEQTHAKAVTACAAHEHSLNANALTIVSSETRERVVRKEEAKLENLKSQCLKVQEQCALTCDEEVETASLDGADLSVPLDKLTDCRQGQVAKHIRVMDRKLNQLRRILSSKSRPGQSIKNASNR